MDNSVCREWLKTSLIIIFGLVTLISNYAFAEPNGISGFSGANGSNCSSCHSGGSTSTIANLTGSTTVSPGSVTSYSLSMVGGPAVNSGLDISVSAGTISDTNASGTQILNGELVHSSPNSVSGGTVSWTFDWQAPTTPGTYTIYAAVLSGDGDGGTSGDSTDATSLQITVAGATNQIPTADIAGPTTGIEGVAVTFDGSGSSDPDGTIVSYDWDFGDGSMGTGVSVTHTYNGGTYDVSLTVTDDAGATDTVVLTINIAVPNVAPTAAISGPNNGTEGIAVSFDGSGSSDLDGSIVTYDWNFGDNTAGSGVSVDHVFSPGTYTVTLTVTDNEGATGNASLNIDIVAATVPQLPVANAGGPYSETVGVAVQFDGSASSDLDGTIQSYEWDFGDGNSGTGVGPVHIYTASGTFTVSLTVTDNDQQTGTAQTTTEITAVAPPPPPDPDPTDPTPEPSTPGEELYNSYCSACHGPGGTGGKDGDVTGESAEDIIEAIDEEKDMAFLADVLTESDIDAIAAYLDGEVNNCRDSDSRRDKYRHRHTNDGANTCLDNDNDSDGDGDGDGRGNDSGEANASSDSSSGGGALHWFILLLSSVWFTSRLRK